MVIKKRQISINVWKNIIIITQKPGSARRLCIAIGKCELTVVGSSSEEEVSPSS